MLAAGAGAAKLSKTAKDTQFDTPSTLPKAEAADCKSSPLPPGPCGCLESFWLPRLPRTAKRGQMAKPCPKLVPPLGSNVQFFS